MYLNKQNWTKTTRTDNNCQKNALRWTKTKMDRNRQKWTETDRNKPKKTEADIIGQG